MNWRNWLFLAILAALTLSVCACSKEQVSEKAKGTGLTTRKAAKAIEEYGKRPIDKAREVQLLGEKRTKAIDEATKKMNADR